MPRCSLTTHMHTRDMMCVSANAFVSDESCNEMRQAVCGGDVSMANCRACLVNKLIDRHPQVCIMSCKWGIMVS